MKFHNLPKAEVRDSDCASMRDAIAFLLEFGVDVRRPANSNFQLKLDERTSYYPGKGTIFVDGEPQARPERGRAALEAWVVQLPQTVSLSFC